MKVLLLGTVGGGLPRVKLLLSNSSLLAQIPPAHFGALTTGGSQQFMRHFISESLIMAELQRDGEPQLLNGDVLKEEREDPEAPEIVKKKRRKKKRNKTTAPGKRHPH